MKDKRKFIMSICVKNGTKRHRIECCSASIYGGNEGLFRIRHNRKWVDINKQKTFMNYEMLSKFICNLFNENQEIEECPNIPKGTRCFVIIWDNNNSIQLGGITGSEPIQDYNGVWQVYIIACAYNGFYPCKNLIIHGRKNAK